MHSFNNDDTVKMGTSTYHEQLFIITTFRMSFKYIQTAVLAVVFFMARVHWANAMP